MLSQNSAEIAAVLLEARRRITEDGFLVGAWPDRPGNSPVTPRPGWTLFDAIWDQPVSVGRWEARALLDRLTRSYLREWSSHPYRTKEEAISLLDAALLGVGARIPKPKPVHRGGWAIYSGGAR